MSRCNDKYLLSDTINDTFFFVFLNWKGLLFLPTNHTRRIFMGLNGDGRRRKRRKRMVMALDLTFLLR